MSASDESIGSSSATEVGRPPRSLTGATSASIAVGLAVQACLVVTGPLLARMLGPEGRGHFAALLLWPAVMASVGTLGIPAAVTYFLARKPSSARALARAGVSFAVPQAVLLALLHALVLFLFLAEADDSLRAAGIISLAAVPALLAQQYGLAMLQGRGRFRAFNVLRLLPVALYALSVAFLFVAGTEDIRWTVLAWIAAMALVGATSLAMGIRSALTAAAEDDADLREMVGFGIRGVFGGTSAIETFRLDQMVLAIFLTPAALGIYVVGLAFTNLPHFIGKSVGMIAFPSVAATGDEHRARRSMWQFFWANLGLNALVVVPILALAPWLVPLFFGSDFEDAVRITYIVLPGIMLLSSRRVLTDGLRGRGHPAIGTVSELVALVWLVLALAVLAPLGGVEGVAFAVTSSYAISFLVLLLLAAKAGEVRRRDALAFSPRSVWGQFARAVAARPR